MPVSLCVEMDALAAGGLALVLHAGVIGGGAPEGVVPAIARMRAQLPSASR